MSIEDVLDKYLPGGAANVGLFHSELGKRLLDRLKNLSSAAITRQHLNQMLHLAHLPGVGGGFFRYYFLENPNNSHPYNLDRVLEEPPNLHPTGIQSIPQLEWGVRRFFIDALLYYGNITTAYTELIQLTFDDLEAKFRSKGLSSKDLQQRGAIIPLESIPIDDRYLIGELACKAYDLPADGSRTLVERKLLDAWHDFRKEGRKKVLVKELLSSAINVEKEHQYTLSFAVDEILDEEIESDEELETRIRSIASRFLAAREQALVNTHLYLSVVNDLDVYVATSMRSREHFRDMARNCDQIFKHAKLQGFELRYFDPTLSACDGHEDKGIIECLMVKCSKVLVYFAGEKDSFGKDSEAAMALSQGKPVVIVCPNETRMRFFRDVHPLTRMIDMNTGVPVGAIITSDTEQVVTLLERILHNSMEYDLEHDGNGYYRLRERLTESVVRLQTSFKLLRDTFWTYYHGVS